MKKIYAQKQLFLFMNGFSILFAILGLIGGLTKDNSFFQILIIPPCLTLLSLTMLINKIYYNETQIRFSFISRKTTINFSDIQEIYIQRSAPLSLATPVIINFDKKVSVPCNDYFQYIKLLKKENIKNTIFLTGITKKDLNKLLKYCNCPKYDV